MGNLSRITIIPFVYLFCHVYGNGFNSFIRDFRQDIGQEMEGDETATLFELGSQLRSLGIPEIKVTQDGFRGPNNKTFSISYGNNRYFKTRFFINGPNVFLSEVNFNLFNIKGTFRNKEKQKSNTQVDQGVAYQFMSKKHCNEHRYGSFSSSQEAKQRCSEDRSCKGVYVKSCDQSDGVHLCYKGYSYDSSSYSCVYNKLSGSSGPTHCSSDQFKCNDNRCIAGYQRCNGRNDCQDESDESMCGINLTYGINMGSEDPIDLEGIISTDKKNGRGNDLNAIMRIKVIPQREKFGLEISFSNYLSQGSYLGRQIEREILPSKGFRFENIKKLEASLKVEIPLRSPRMQLSMLDIGNYIDAMAPTGAKAELKLKVMGDIPEQIEYGDGKPGTYILSASTKVNKFGYLRGSPPNPPTGGKKVILRIDLKDQVVFDDGILNDQTNFHNIDASFGFDGYFNRRALIDERYGKKFLDMKLTELNSGTEYGTIQTLVVDAGSFIRAELDVSSLGRHIIGWNGGPGASKLSLNFRKFFNGTSDGFEIFFEANEFEQDDVSGPRNDPEACNVDFLKETNYVDQNYESNTMHSDSNNLPTKWMDAYPEWTRYRSNICSAPYCQFGFNISNGITWKEPNPCNKYMIYETRTDINQIIRRVYIEPLFFFGRWFGETFQQNRKDRSLILEEKIYFKGNGSFDIYHTLPYTRGHFWTFPYNDIFARRPDAYDAGNNDVDAVQILTSYQRDKPSLQVNFTQIYPIFQSSNHNQLSNPNTDSQLNVRMGLFEITCPSNGCNIKIMKKYGGGHIQSPLYKQFDATIYDGSFIFNRFIGNVIYDYVMNRIL